MSSRRRRAVTPQDRRLIETAFSDPLSIPPDFKGWLESYLEPIFDRLGSAAGVRVPATIKSYDVSLPASPADEDLAVLVDSLTSPTYSWLFRYHAGSSNTDKWEALGPMPITKEPSALNFSQTPGTSYANLTNRVNFTVPRAGVYRVRTNGWLVLTGGAIAHLSLKKGSATALDGDSINTAAAINAVSSARGYAPMSLSASDVLELQLRTTTAAIAVTVAGAILEVSPIRVS